MTHKKGFVDSNVLEGESAIRLEFEHAINHQKRITMRQQLEYAFAIVADSMLTR